MAALGLDCGIWDLVPRRIEPRPLTLGALSLNHWKSLGSLFIIELYVLDSRPLCDLQIFSVIHFLDAVLCCYRVLI